ncbi:MAG: S41 family peptidase [Candidatus Zixiibacteriota bacterium]
MKLERLPGNIGYLDLRQFVGAEFAGQTAVNAMGFLANTDAIIFDLRQNGGGDPSMIQLLTSYLLKEPTHLNSFYIRQTDSIAQFWSAAWVPGQRLEKADVYVLTSSFTFSGAEEFTYNLKNLKRATIIGETTGGGAHPVEEHFFPSLHFGARIPFGRAINPISGTNWEGTGVKPDIEIPADKALVVAQQTALKKLLEKASSEDQKREMAWTLEGLEASLNPVTMLSTVLQSYTGTYGERTITLEEGRLYYQREGRPRFQLMPMAKDLFQLHGMDNFRLKILRDASGTVTGLEGRYADGFTDQSPKGPKP